MTSNNKFMDKRRGRVRSTHDRQVISRDLIAHGRVGVLITSLVILPAVGYPADGCWVDLYDQPNCQGNHVRIQGPAELSSLKKIEGSDWSNRIESLKVGADARFTGYRRESFDTSHPSPTAHPDAFKSWGDSQLPAYLNLEINVGPETVESHLAELDFHRKIQSLKVMCER
jgi:hypothetical protein